VKSWQARIFRGAKGCVRLTIKDTGMGIDSDILDKIFDPYFSTKKEGKGSGIGLSVVHGIVESHNGLIRVETRKGTCFDIYFPVSEKISLTNTNLNHHLSKDFLKSP